MQQCQTFAGATPRRAYPKVVVALVVSLSMVRWADFFSMTSMCYEIASPFIAYRPIPLLLRLHESVDFLVIQALVRDVHDLLAAVLTALSRRAVGKLLPNH